MLPRPMYEYFVFLFFLFLLCCFCMTRKSQQWLLFQLPLTLSPVMGRCLDYTTFRVDTGVTDVNKTSRLFAVTSTTRSCCCMLCVFDTLFSAHRYPASTIHLCFIARKKTFFLPILRSNRQLEPPLPLNFSCRTFLNSALAPNFSFQP